MLSSPRFTYWFYRYTHTNTQSCTSWFRFGSRHSVNLWPQCGSTETHSGTLGERCVCVWEEVSCSLKQRIIVNSLESLLASFFATNLFFYFLYCCDWSILPFIFPCVLISFICYYFVSLHLSVTPSLHVLLSHPVSLFLSCFYIWLHSLYPSKKELRLLQKFHHFKSEAAVE